MKPHHDDLEQVIKHFDSNPEHGLSGDEAKKRLSEYGENKLKEGTRKTNLQRFIEQFKDVMILILLAAAIISFIVAIYEREGFVEPILIVAIVVLNAIMGVMQESKAEKALEALRELSSPQSRVIRDGTEQIIEASQLVPGDIILVEAGDYVPADARLINSVSLKSEESALTGESVPSEKSANVEVAIDAPLGDRYNMIFSGCGISYGRAKAIVTGTGMNTEMGKIANLLAQGNDSTTPLQQKLAKLGKYLGIVALVACVVIFVIGILNDIYIMDIFMISVSFAKKLNILGENDDVVSGQELELMSESELTERVKDISVYARVSPSDKIRIVRAWQQLGAVVAMTGDGVNDAPALKAADIGCAMGITGTDVAKGAADMILTDDNFSTIVEAIGEGRSIYDNVKKVIGFLLGTNVGEILTVFLAMLIWKKTPLLAMQLLWINLVTDSLPAIALGMEPPEDDIMTRKPKPKGESIFANRLGLQVILQGIMFAVLTLTGFILGWRHDGDIVEGRTMAFFILSLVQVIHSFNMRSSHSLLHIGVFTNKALNKAAIVSTILIGLVVFVPPIASIFGLSQLNSSMYILAAILAFIPVIVMEIIKALGLFSKS